MIRVFLAGEGANELGVWHRERPYLPADEDELRRAPVGVLEALLGKVRADGWRVESAEVWKRIKKYAVGRRMPAEVRNVLGAALQAKEAGCDVLVFSRDRDADEERASDIEHGLSRARESFGQDVSIVGGCAVEMLEGWLLALRGERHSEEHRHPEARLQRQGVPLKDTPAYVAIVENADLKRLPEDAVSLRGWLESALAAFQELERRDETVSND